MFRYDRQRRVGERGAGRDDRLASLRVLLVGVGGIGAPVALSLVRAGVGHLILIDPDTVAEADLSRQVLYFEEDALASRQKTDAAVRELTRIGGRTVLEGRPIGLTAKNAVSLVEEVDLVIDASDHLPVRFWIDEACRETERPWIHTAALGESYVVAPFLSPGPPCFRCYIPEAPSIESIGTCETAGVLPVATALAAQHALAALWSWLSLEPNERWRHLTEDRGGRVRPMLRGSVHDPAPRIVDLRPDPACRGCGTDRGPIPGGSLRLLCGRRRVEGWLRISTEESKEGLGLGGGPWEIEEYADELHARCGDETLVLFEDGRLVYGPAEDLDRARGRLEEILGQNRLI